MVTELESITTVEQLEQAYPNARRGPEVPAGAWDKVTTIITPLQRKFIEASPFVVMSTTGSDGPDSSPRGDPAGFARVVDETTVLMPDRRGNNRLDSLRNMVENGGIGLLFLIPGINVTMRLNGTARLITDVPLRESFAMGDKIPATVIEVKVHEVYTQCPKALVRSKLWDPNGFQTHDTVPTVGQIMEEVTKGGIDGVSYDDAYPERMKNTIY